MSRVLVTGASGALGGGVTATRLTGAAIPIG